MDHKFTGRENWKSDYSIQTTQMWSKKCSAVRIKGIMEEYDGQDQESRDGVLTWPSVLMNYLLSIPLREGIDT